MNDVVLAVARRARSGASSTAAASTSTALDFRAMVPVNVRDATSTRGELGNRVAMMVARLPLDERDPRERLERVDRRDARRSSARTRRAACRRSRS